MKINIVCVIDDDPLFQHLMKKLIKRALPEHELLQFENGKLALDFFNKKTAIAADLPQLIFVDINMPLLNGWQFLEGFEILSIPDYAPAIYMASSSCDKADIDLAASYAQLQGYLIKPIPPAELSGIIQGVYKTDQ